MDKYGKPVVIDECCCEGELPEDGGSITGMEMTDRFWRTYCRGGYCTHGETFDPGNEEAAVWWAKGGKLRGESPAMGKNGMLQDGPGYKKVRIAPVTGYLTHASGTVKTPGGTIRVSWKIEDGAFKLDYEVPQDMEVVR